MTTSTGFGRNLRTAALLGLVTSTFSTVVATLGAARIGRDVSVDWMVIASLVMRDAALNVEPGRWAIALGVAIHQSADFAWAVLFFGVLGRWTGRLSPAAIALLALPWAALTSAIEWFVIVPLWPFRQPVFTLEQAYWLGFTVHALSSSLYPLYPWLRHRSAPRFTAAWSAAAVGVVVLFGTLAWMGSHDQELRHMGSNAAWDRAYMRRMAAHHAQGVVLASMAAERAENPHLRAVARLMVATQDGEIDLLAQWWRSWFDDPAGFVCSEQERAAMPGMLGTAQLDALRHARGEDFDAAFMQATSHHHRGAIVMADEGMRRASDFRLRLMSHAIRHEQRGEIAMMRGINGWPAVVWAARAMVAPAGSHPADSP